MIRKANLLAVLPALLIFAAAGPAPALAAVPDAPSRTFAPQDLFSLQAAVDPQISPDGTRIAYVRRSGDIMSDRMRPTIWLVDRRTGQQSPLVTGPGSHSQPRWSPDGKRLAYVSSAEGDGAQLFVRWMDGGATVRVTGLPQSPSSIAWSPDGTRIAYVMQVPGEDPKLGAPLDKPEGAQWAPPLEVHDMVTYRTDDDGYLKPGFNHIFVVSADAGAPRQLSFGSVHDFGPLSWTPDGRTIVFSSNRESDWERAGINTEVYALDVASSTITALTHRDGPDQEPIVSPDGRLIPFTGFDDRKLGYQTLLLYVLNR